MQRIKSMKEFVVESEIPDNFEFRGKIPYDMKIVDGVGYFTVYAVDLNEAQTKVEEFLNR